VKIHTLRRLSGPALVALVGVLAAVPAAAQQQPSEIQSWSIPGWTFTPGISIGALFDSNVAIAGPDVNGNTASDTMLQMEPFGQLEFRSPRTTFSSGYRGSLHRYFDLSALNGADHRAYVQWRERLTRRVLLFVNDDYQQVATTDLLQLNDLPFQRLGARHNTASGGVEARISKSLDLDVRYEHGWVKFERFEPLDPRTGGIVQGVRSDLTHRLTERLSIGGTYSLRRSNMNEGTRQQTFQEAGGLLRYRVAERTSIEVAGGLSHLADVTLDRSQTGSFVKGSITHRADRATFGADYNRDYKPSFGFGAATMNDDVSGYIRMPLSRNRLYVQESASLRARPVAPLDELEIERRSTWINSTLGYALQRWVRLEGYWAFTRQDTPRPGGQINRHVIGAQVSISEPMRIR
jgi:hypothetical protein